MTNNFTVKHKQTKYVGMSGIFVNSELKKNSELTKIFNTKSLNYK